MQYLAQCEHSISNLSVSKKDVDHGAAGAEVPNKNIPWSFSYVIFRICDSEYLFCRLYPSRI